MRSKIRTEHTKTKEKQYAKAYRQKFVWRRLLGDARKRAKALGLAFDLDSHVDEFRKRVELMVCELTGIPLISGVGAGSQGKRYWNTASIDRRNPELGYTFTNIRIVCWAMNASMGTWGEEILYAVVTSWLRKRQGEGTPRADVSASSQGNLNPSVWII